MGDTAIVNFVEFATIIIAVFWFLFIRPRNK